MANYQYGLYPWGWDESLSRHTPPDGAGSVLDLRPLSEQAKLGQSAGWGFFAWPGNRPGDAIDLGSGDCREIQPTTAQRDELRIKLGLSANPDGTMLVDCLADVLGDKSDPTGATGPKPILPSEGSYEIHLPGHSRVWALLYDGAEILSANPRGRANKVRDVIRSDMRAAIDAGGPELAAKVLGHVLRRHGYSDAEVNAGAPGRRAEWARLFRPADLQRAGGNGFRPKRPRTSYSESFNKSDSDTLGPDLTWAEVTGDIDVVSNRASTSTTGFAEARAEHDVSSADHFGQVQIYQTSTSGGDNHLAAPCARFAAAARTFYSFAWFATGLFLYKTVAGAYSIIGSVSETPAALPATWKVDCSGSTIRGLQNGTQKVSVTDTSITGNTRGGFWLYRASGVQVIIDDFTVDDGVSAGGTRGIGFGARGTAFNGGRTFRGNMR